MTAARGRARRISVVVVALIAGLAALLVWLGREPLDTAAPAATAAEPATAAPPVTESALASLPEPGLRPIEAPLALLDPNSPAAGEQSPTPPTYDLLTVLVVNTAGRPISGAQVSDDSGPRSAITGDDGRATLSVSLQGSAGLDVSAYEFCPQHLALPAPPRDTARPLRVELVRSSSLDLHLTDVAGRPATMAQVRLAYQGRLFAPGAQFVFEELKDDGPPQHPTKVAVRRFAPDATGRCLIIWMLPDVPFELAVEDGYGAVLNAPQRIVLGLEERRPMSLQVSCLPHALVVTVRDAAGAPLEGARVTVVADGVGETTRSSVGITKADGRAGFGGLCIQSVGIQAVKDGFGTAWIRDAPVLADNTPAELSLGAAMTVEISVVDESGSPRKADFVGIEGPPIPIAADPTRDSGRYRLSDLPAGQVLLSVRKQGRRWELLHDTAIPQATITIPTPGALEVRCDLHSLKPGAAFLQLSSPEHGECTLLPTNGRLEGANTVLTFGAVLPGTYEASLFTGGRYDESAAPISEAATVTIAADSTTEITLTRR